MYRYDEIDQRLVDDRVRQFRDQTRRFLAGELSDEEFKHLRLRNGLYLQRHAPMLRVAIPYGLLSTTQLRKLAHIGRTYDRGYGHFTTRQNLQFNWPRLEDVPEILAELATVEMHAIQTSGNCVRNITTDHFAGVAADEIVDSFAWCELVRQWSTFSPEFSWLPRKFKIAINGAAADRAATWVHDIGLHALRNDAGEIGFKVIVGGGLGRTPIIGHVVREFLPWQHLLTYLDAILRVYNRYGRRDNIHKARIKILVKDLGPDAFRREVEEEWAHLKDGPATLVPEEIARIESRFTRPAHERLPADDPGYAAALAVDRAFAAWVKRNVHAHKVPGYAAVTLSLKRTGVPPGDVTADQMDAIADLADRYSFGELRVSHEQNLIFADVAKRDLHALWRELRALGARDAQHRAADEHHLLPGRRLLLARERALDPGRRGDPAPLRRPRLPLRRRRDRPQHLRLHERLRPPPCRPHRHPRRRQGGRGVLPDRDRRQPGRNPSGRAGLARQGDRAVVLARRRARRDRAARPLLPRPPRQRGRTIHRHRRADRCRAFQGIRLWQRSSGIGRSSATAGGCLTTRRPGSSSARTGSCATSPPTAG